MARGTSKAAVGLQPRRREVCPGEAVAFTYEATGLPSDEVRWQVLCRQPALQAAIRHEGDRQRGQLFGQVPDDLDDGSHEVVLRAVDTGGAVIAEDRIIIDVDTAIRLVKPSLSWDAGSLTGSIEVRNCSPFKPELNLRLSCRNGRILVQSSLDMSVAAPGVQRSSFKLAESPTADLGSCRLQLVDKDGEVHDEMDFDQQSAEADSRQHRSEEPRPPRSWPRRVLIGISAIAIIVITILVWPNGPDPPDPNGEAFVELSDEVDGQTFTVTVRNDGDGDLMVERTELIPPSGPFAITGENCIADVVGPDDSCEIAVTAVPRALPGAETELSVVSNAMNSPNNIVLGPLEQPEDESEDEPEAPPRIQLEVEQDGFNFTVIVHNNGGSDLFVEGVELVGQSDAFFIIDQDCIGGSVAPDDFCQFNIELDPPSEGRYDVELQVFSNAQDGPAIVQFGTNAVF